jgi:hypothetical protein
VFTYADLSHVPEIDFQVGGRHYSVYAHDWHATPPLIWLEMMAQREVGGEGAGISKPTPTSEPVLVLSQSEFATAVRDGLRDYANLNALAHNPLLRSRLVLSRAGGEASQTVRVNALRTVLQETADALQEAPRLLKMYRALYHTYFQPAATQEQAAEVLDLPFSTYRRHLRSGIEYITERLWALEIGDLESSPSSYS